MERRWFQSVRRTSGAPTAATAARASTAPSATRWTVRAVARAAGTAPTATCPAPRSDSLLFSWSSLVCGFLLRCPSANGKRLALSRLPTRGRWSSWNVSRKFHFQDAKLKLAEIAVRIPSHVLDWFESFYPSVKEENGASIETLALALSWARTRGRWSSKNIFRKFYFEDTKLKLAEIAVRIASYFIDIFLFFLCSFQGTYGMNCARMCKCRNKAICDHISGACLCAPGWNGPLWVTCFFYLFLFNPHWIHFLICIRVNEKCPLFAFWVSVGVIFGETSARYRSLSIDRWNGRRRRNDMQMTICKWGCAIGSAFRNRRRRNHSIKAPLRSIASNYSIRFRSFFVVVVVFLFFSFFFGGGG